MTTPVLLRGDARALPLADNTVDLIVTSPPYFGLRDYGTEGQIGAEPTPADFLDALIDCTREMARVLKPSGSIFVNLGDKYSGAQGQTQTGVNGRRDMLDTPANWRRSDPSRTGVPAKSLHLLPERYRIQCVDELGLIARAVIVWSKPNGLPESVTDRVRRSHEDWVHLTLRPRYFEAVDEIREEHAPSGLARRAYGYQPGHAGGSSNGPLRTGGQRPANPLGKLPGSVWTIPTQPLKVPAELGVDHFAAFPMEWPRRLILGWSPREVCTACSEGRRPVAHVETTGRDNNDHPGRVRSTVGLRGDEYRQWRADHPRTITGYACACPDTTAPATPGIVLDPFSGTGTTALVAAMLGRRGIGVDLSPDYQRLATWRASDPKERARGAGLDPDAVAAIPRQTSGQLGLFDGAAS